MGRVAIECPMSFRKIKEWVRNIRLRVVLTTHGLDQETIKEVIESDDVDKDVAELNRSCRETLVGVWTTADSNWAMLMGERLTVRPDGNGIFEDKYGVTRFEWQQTDDFSIQFRETGYEPNDGGEEMDEEDDLLCGWVTVRYTFIPLSTSSGEIAVLVELDKNDQLREGFWIAMHALAGPYAFD